MFPAEEAPTATNVLTDTRVAFLLPPPAWGLPCVLFVGKDLFKGPLGCLKREVQSVQKLHSSFLGIVRIPKDKLGSTNKKQKLGCLQRSCVTCLGDFTVHGT